MTVRIGPNTLPALYPGKDLMHNGALEPCPDTPKFWIKTLASNDDLHGSTDILEPIDAAGDDLDSNDALEPTTHSAKTGRNLRKPVLVGVAALVIALVAGGGVLVAAHKNVTLTVDGQQQDVGTLAGSVEGALDSAGLTINEHDTVAPAVDTPISDGSQIVVERGRLLTLTIDGQTKQVWTTATTVEEALAELGQNPAAYKLSADRSREIPVEGLAVSADTLYNASVSDGGAAASAVQTTAKTVGALLTEQGVVLGAEDTVTPAVDTALSDGLAVQVTRIATTSVTEEVEVPQPADQQVEDDSMDAGTSTVTQQGAPGKDSVTYQVVTTNGQQTAKNEASRTPITAAQPTITTVGTKKAVVARSSSSSSGLVVLVEQLELRFVRLQFRAGLLRFQRDQLGRHRQLRVDQQLVDQHRQRLLRRPAIRYRNLVVQWWRAVRAARRSGHPRTADRGRRNHRRFSWHLAVGLR